MNNDDTSLKPWKLLHNELAFETPWFTIQKEELETPKGAKPTYFIHHSHDSAMCVCVTDDNRLLIERQYRPAIRRISIDYPAGALDEIDGSPAEAMLRELEEETGYKVKEFKKLATIENDPGFSSSKMHIFLASGATPGQANPEDNEDIIAKFTPAKDVLALIDSSEMACAYCVSATFYAFRELGWLKLAL
jgi:ADP-ribose pyrophosphatase